MQLVVVRLVTRAVRMVTMMSNTRLRVRFVLSFIAVEFEVLRFYEFKETFIFHFSLFHFSLNKSEGRSPQLLILHSSFFLGLLLFSFLLLGRPVGSGLAFVLSLEGSGLGLARGGLLELGIAAEVLEGLAGVVVHAHRLDVLGRELLLRLGAFGGDGGSEGADFTQVHLIALQDQFAHAHAQLREDADDGALGEHAVVLGDVLGELVDVDDAGELQVGISLLSLFGLHGVGHHGRTVLNLLHTVFLK